MEQKYIDIAVQLIEGAKALGAEEADAFLELGREFDLTIRDRKVEVLKQAFSKGIGLRVFHKQKLGFSHSNDFSTESLNSLVERTLQMAKFTTSDEHNGLPDILPAATADELEIFDFRTLDLTPDQKIRFAREMEEAALNTDRRIKLVEGSSYSDIEHHVLLVNSKGFQSKYKGTSSLLSCSVVAEEDSRKQVNYWHSSKRFFSDHGRIADIGLKAAKRSLEMLGGKKIKSGKFPVVFDPITASSFVGAIAAAVDGEMVRRKMSFLADKLGEKVAPGFLTLYDDGTRKRGLGTHPFDGDGVRTSRKAIIQNGILKSFIYDTYTSRKVNGVSTGNAARSYNSPPHISPTNFYIENGSLTPNEIVKNVGRGLLVKGLIGFGVDTVSGHFSKGAHGIWIENGELAFPVEEITIASSLTEMLERIEMVGNDLFFQGSIGSPTIMISEMTIGGY